MDGFRTGDLTTSITFWDHFSPDNVVDQEQ